MTTALTSADPTVTSYENVLTKLHESQTPKRASLFNLVIILKTTFFLTTHNCSRDYNPISMPPYLHSNIQQIQIMKVFAFAFSLKGAIK